MQQPVNGNIEHKLCEKREELCTVVSTAIFQVFQMYAWVPTVMTVGGKMLKGFDEFMTYRQDFVRIHSRQLYDSMT